MRPKEQIIKCYREGLTREEAFQRLCPGYGLLSVDGALVTRWFKDLGEKKEYPNDIIRDYSDLLYKVYQIYNRNQKTISVWPATLHDSFCYSDPRYALIVDETDDLCTCYVLDCFHGQMRQLQFVGLNLKKFHFVEVIDSEHLLLRLEFFDFYLMRLNLTNLTCTFLDKFTIEDGKNIGFLDIMDTLFDENNRHHFYVVYSDKDLCSLTYFQIVDSKFVSGQSIRFDMNFLQLKYTRLIDNLLQGFGGDNKQYFGEYSLAAVNPNRSFRKLFELKTNLNLFAENYEVTGQSYVWCQDTCYIAEITHQGEFIQLNAFDLNTRQLRQVKFSLFDSSLLVKMNLDKEDGNILTLYTWDNRDYKNVIRRFALRRPETLANLVLFQLRRDAMFRKSKVFDNVALPPSLRPFPMCNDEEHPNLHPMCNGQIVSKFLPHLKPSSIFNDQFFATLRSDLQSPPTYEDEEMVAFNSWVAANLNLLPSPICNDEG